MTERIGEEVAESTDLVQAVLDLGGLALDFARVERAPYHQDGIRRETDSDHTVMLALIGCALAEKLRPDLDLGKVAQFCLVHDLVEAYAGDTVTLDISEVDREAKEEREAAALLRIHEVFDSTLPWIGAAIDTYESRESPEARFVKTLDKLMPKITHILNKGQYLKEQGLTKEDIEALYERQPELMIEYAFDQPELLSIKHDLEGYMMRIVYPD